MTRSSMPEGRRRIALESIGVVPINVQGAGAGLASLAAGIGRFADGVAEADGIRQRNDAADQAQNSVTRNADNTIAIAENPFSDPRARATFASQQRQLYVAKIGLDGTRAATDLHVQNPTDPAAFDAAWTGRTEGTLAQVPTALREDARRKLAELGTTHRNAIVLAQANQAKALAASAFDAELKSAKADVFSLAQAGRIPDPEYLARIAKHSEILMRGVDNQFITQEHASLFSRQLADEAEGLGVAAVAEKAYMAAGRGSNGVLAAQKLVRETISGNAESALAPERKNEIENLVLARVRDLEAQRRVEAQDASVRADADLGRLRLGIQVDLTTLDGHRRALLAAGEPERAQTLGRAMATAGEVRATALQPLAAIDARMATLDAKRRDGTATASEGEALQQLLRIRQAKADALQTDAFAYGQAAHRDLLGPAPALDFNNPDALAVAVQTRMRQARILSDRELVPVAPFTVPELAQIATLAQSRASPAEQLDFVARATVDLKDDAAAGIVLQSLERNGFKDTIGGMRVALDIWQTGDRNRARRIWGELSISDKDIPISATVDKTVKTSVDANYRSGPGAVLDAAYLATGDARFAKRIQDELEAATKIARVRASSGGRTNTADAALSDLFGDRRGFAERGFAAVTFPATADRNAFEEGLRALRPEMVGQFVASLPPELPPLQRAQIERAWRDAVWLNLGDGYTLTVPGTGAPMRGPDGREIRVLLDAILARGAADRAAERAAAVPARGALAEGAFGIGGAVSADDPLAALQRAAEQDRKRRETNR